MTKTIDLSFTANEVKYVLSLTDRQLTALYNLLVTGSMKENNAFIVDDDLLDELEKKLNRYGCTPPVNGIVENFSNGDLIAFLNQLISFSKMFSDSIKELTSLVENFNQV
ncbi:MAG: hypothetical protein ACRC78_01510 [Planktothrix sp.]